MSDEKKSIWGYIIALIGGFVLGIIAYIRLGRNPVSSRTGDGINRVGEQLDKVVESVSGAEERSKETVGDVGELRDQVDRVSEGTDRIEDEIGNATESVVRLKDLIRRERERIEQSYSKK